jgi:hypothetical protein
VLTVFVLIGLLWVYFHIDAETDYDSASQRVATLTAAETAAIDRRDAREQVLTRARDAQAGRRRELVDRREAYRTGLDEGRRDPGLERRYRAGQLAYERAQQRRLAAVRAYYAAVPAARAAEDRESAIGRREQARLEAQRRHDGRVSLARRLVFVLAWLGLSYLLLDRLRRRRSRWLIAGFASVAAIALLALVMAIDYLTDYIEVTELGVLVLAAAGTLMTIGAFAVLQRYLARRLPERRVRKRECPFCGYPAGAGPHCEGCGRDVLGACTSCHAERRIGTRRCAACGQP